MRRSDFDVQVGNRLRMARFRAKLTPAELAKMVGSDEAEIESWETGSSVIYLNELVVLCKALNVSPNILHFRSDWLSAKRSLQSNVLGASRLNHAGRLDPSFPAGGQRLRSLPTGAAPRPAPRAIPSQHNCRHSDPARSARYKCLSMLRKTCHHAKSI